MDPLLDNLSPILTLLGVITAAWFTYRGSNRKLQSDSGMQLLNERQEEVATLRAENRTLRTEGRVKDDYIAVLRRHIADGQAPPPPPWPDSLVS